MKRKDVTREQFAEWSFERDFEMGIYDDEDDWPQDILVRLED